MKFGWKATLQQATPPRQNFAEACAVWNREKGHPGYFDPERLTYWGCRFFDNEHNARKSFG